MNNVTYVVQYLSIKIYTPPWGSVTHVVQRTTVRKSVTHVMLRNRYSLDLFYDNLSRIQAKSYTVVIDACFSGASIYENISPIMIEMKSPIAKLKNAAIFSSSSGDQVSAWYNEKNHSLFTYYFLKGIHNWNADLNKDKTITYQELYDYLSDDTEGVPYWARRLHNVEQKPVLQGDAQGLPLIRY